MSSIDVDTYAAGATTSASVVEKVTVEGTLDVDSFVPSSLSATEKEEAAVYFESAITQQLESQHLLPDGASVVVTAINDNGTVDYEIHFYGNDAGTTSAAKISSIESSLAQPSTLSAISTIVQNKAGKARR